MLNKYVKQQFLKVKDSLLELEKDFIESKDRELKDKEVKKKERWKNYFLNRLLCLQMYNKFEKKRNEENKAS